MTLKDRTFPLEVKEGSVRVKIYRVTNKGNPSYVVCHYLNGKRQLKAFVDFEEAHQEAKSIANKLAQGELDVLHLKNADRTAYVRAIEALRPTGVPLEVASLQFAEVSRVTNGSATLLDVAKEYARRQVQPLPVKTVSEAVAEMLKIKEAEGASQSNLKVLRLYLNRLASAFQCQLSMVRSGDVADFIGARPVAPRTKNNARQVIGTFFRFCRQRGWLIKDHDGVSLISKFRETPGPVEIFTPKELKTFLKYARPELVPFLVLGAFAGIRSAELARLDWKEVNLEEGFIEIKAAKAKTASRRIVPVLPNLQKWLLPYAKAEGPVVPFANIPNSSGGWPKTVELNGSKMACAILSFLTG